MCILMSIYVNIENAYVPSTSQLDFISYRYSLFRRENPYAVCFGHGLYI